MKTQKSNLTKTTYSMLKLAQEANLLALEVALEASKGKGDDERLLKIADEIKRLADQASTMKDELILCLSEVEELNRLLSQFKV